MVCRIRMLLSLLRSMLSELGEFEVFLARSALWTGPVRRHVLPFGSWRNPFVRGAESLVVDPSADEAHVYFHCVKAGARSRGVKSCNSSKTTPVRRVFRFPLPVADCGSAMTASCVSDFPAIVLTFAASVPTGGGGLQ